MAQTGHGADDGADMVWDGGDYLYLSPGAYVESSSGGCDEYEFWRYSISGNTWAQLTDQPSSKGAGNGNDDGGSSGLVGEYIYHLKGGDGSGSTLASDFYRYQMAPATPTAWATGPTGSTNNPSGTLTYTYTSSPTSVKLYYTKDGGTSWTLAGEDTSVDSTFAYIITSGDGTYGWNAVAIGGGSTETDPPAGGTPPEAASLILDRAPTLIAPANGFSENDNTPTFEWSSVISPGGVTYQIQIDDNADLISPVYFAVGLVENNHTLPGENALASGTYFWRVRAVDNVGNACNWSSIWTLFIIVGGRWMQSNWAGGPTKPSLQVGTWDDAYDNFYDNDNVNWLDGVRLDNYLGSWVTDHVIISEFATRGSSSVYDEFVELYNPTSSAIDIGGWIFEYWHGTAWVYYGYGTTVAIGTIPSGATIPAHGFYLWGNSRGYVSPGSGPTPDWTTYGNGLADGASGSPRGIRLKMPDNVTVIDTVVFEGNGNTSNTEAEGGYTAPGCPTSATTVSIERKAQSTSTASSMASGGVDENSGNAYDSNNNYNDWVRRSSRNPQNSSSTLENPIAILVPQFRSAGWFESSIYDAGGVADWKIISWIENKPSGTSIIVEARTGGDNNPYDGGWSGWYQHSNSAENALMENGRYIQYRVELSTTDGAKTPKLSQITLNYELVPVIIRGVDVLISPSSQSGLSGITLIYTVTVTNTGNVSDTYTLENKDNLGWTKLSKTSVGPLDPFGSSDNTTTLSVTIPDNAIGGTIDNIKVTATSQTDNTVSGSGSCLAHVSVHAGLTPHAPILIVGNDNFTLANGVTSGSGTVGDPYIIENYIIDASTANGIEIRNTTAHFVVRNCVVENGWIAENGVNYYGIKLDNVVNGRVENCTCKNNDYGILLITNSNNNALTNNTCENNIWYGIRLEYSSNNVLTNNTCENTKYYGIGLHDADNNTLDNNTCENNGGGIYLYDSDNIKMRNNTLSNNLHNFGMEGTTLSHFVHDIDNSNLVNGKPIRYLMGHSNEVIGPSLEMGYLGLVNCDNIRVENLVLEHNIQGILIASTQDSRVENCIFENNGWGIYLWGSYNNILTNNTCENGGRGIQLLTSNNNILANNICEDDNYFGIRLGYSDNNIIKNNTFSSENEHGVRLYSSDNNIIENNTISNDNLDGIWFENDSVNNTIRNNNITSNNRYGIYILNSNDNNRIYHNNFLNNENQAYDNGSNYWDDGYPYGGNYWSDYTGADNYRGENQNILGSDGIGDTPYYIPGDNNRDRYPLMNPWPPAWVNTGDLENARHAYSLLYAGDGAVYAGTASGDDSWNSVGVVFKTTDGGTTWVPTASLGGLGVVGNIEAMIQTSGGTIDNNILIGTAWEGKIFRTTNGGDNWIEVVDLPGVVEVDSLIQAANGDLYAGTHYSGGTDEARIYRSTNYGDNWEVVAAPSIDGELSGCTVVECLIQASTGYFYCGTQPGHVWRSDNGDNWYKVGDKDNDFGGSYKIYSLSETSGGYIYVASRNPGNVYRSTDNGNTWTEVANGVTELGGATRTDGLYQASNGMIYVGTDVGKIYRSANGDNWVLEVTLPADRVNAIIEADLGWMYAGTSYNGDVFTTYISPVIPYEGTATFKLENLYKVSLEKDLTLNTGSKLVVKFYTYTGDNQGESVIENFVPPITILENENVPHPSGLVPVEIVRLVLTTDDTTNEIPPTIASFTVTRSILFARYTKIKTEYIKPGADKPALFKEYTDIKKQYIKAP